MQTINEITITELGNLYESNKISVKELVQEYINRINSIDRGENGLNSVIEINPEVLEIAAKMDAQHTEKKSKLFGVPILLKDNIETADKMHTSAGSLALSDSFAAEDAEIVKVLRKKDAIVLGKTNMTEFANYMTKGMPSGYSSKGGQVKSPYNKESSPSGSSSGSAVAVAANLCTASLGTDTSGSIVSPAVKNGIVGFRPSYGAQSLKGIIPISFTCDTVGPMTRTVTDAAILFSELSGKHVQMNEEAIIKGVKVGINQAEFNNMTEEEVKKSENIMKELEKSGAIITRIDIDAIPTEDIKRIQRYEFKYAINRYLKTLPAEYSIKTLRDIIEFNEQHAEKTLRYGQSLLTDAEEHTSGTLIEEDYIETLKDREVKKKATLEKLRGVDICLIFKPNLIWQYIGSPIITVPHGSYNDGMPFGIYMTSLTDTDLFQHAYSMEQIIGYRVPPKIPSYYGF